MSNFDDFIQRIKQAPDRSHVMAEMGLTAEDLNNLIDLAPFKIGDIVAIEGLTDGPPMKVMNVHAVLADDHDRDFVEFKTYRIRFFFFECLWFSRERIAQNGTFASRVLVASFDERRYRHAGT